MTQASSTTTTPPLLGCIADDVTGATDLAINLVQGGMRVVQVMGVPSPEVLKHAAEADAVVVALKTRSIPAADAVRQSLASLEALQSLGCSRFYFKYCSTFDSTPAGNIGPVAEALMDALGTAQTIYCPAFPRAGRTVYRGHLFVFDRLLNDSGMQNHPLNPMADADLVRVLEPQTTRPIGLVDYDTLSDADAIRSRLTALADEGAANVVTDTCDNAHLEVLARAVTDLPLVTGGSGLARFLPTAYHEQGLLSHTAIEPYIPDAAGRSLVLSGSCSRATQGQVKWAEGKLPIWAVDIPALLHDPEATLQQVCSWIKQQDASRPVVVASTAPPEQVAALQQAQGTETVATAIETLLGQVAVAAVQDLGVRRILVAGGETSGAVTDALNINAVQIGPEIATGVSWTQTLGQDPPVALAFKSGNFGDEDIFTTAWEKLP